MGTRAVGDGGWIRDYVLLALRTAKAVEARTGDEWMLDFYGPPEWKGLVDAEEPRAGGALVEGACELEGSLPGQGFDEGRARYLGKHLRALETVARRLSGERLSLGEQAAGCFDIEVGWVTEDTFGEAEALYDEALPGKDGVRERLRRWKARHELPREKAALLPALVERATREARRRTDALVGLPEGEEISFGTMTGETALATVEYLGNLRSRITINADWAFNLADLLYVACHEGYPGHLAELVLKERHLAQEKGYVEELVTFTPTPSVVVMEGLALWAREVAFPGDEAQAWLEENVYPGAGIRPDGSDLQEIHAAKDMLWGAQSNAALMLGEGRPPEEAARYLERWALLDEEEASRSIAPMRRPFAEAYIFCYHHGRKLLEDGMRGPDRDGFARRLLTEQVCPSDLHRG